jgi:hypothetical protein
MTPATKDELRAAIHRCGGFYAVAKALGCTRAFLYSLVSHASSKRPSIERAYAMRELLGIDMLAWGAPVSSPKKRRRKRAAS